MLIEWVYVMLCVLDMYTYMLRLLHVCKFTCAENVKYKF